MIEIDGMSIDDYVQSQIDKGEEVIMETYGTMNYSKGRTVILNGSAVIHKAGKRTTLKGKRIVKENGEWFVDGKKVEV